MFSFPSTEFLIIIAEQNSNQKKIVDTLRHRVQKDTVKINNLQALVFDLQYNNDLQDYHLTRYKYHFSKLEANYRLVNQRASSVIAKEKLISLNLAELCHHYLTDHNKTSLAYQALISKCLMCGLLKECPKLGSQFSNVIPSSSFNYDNSSQKALTDIQVLKAEESDDEPKIIYVGKKFDYQKA